MTVYDPSQCAVFFRTRDKWGQFSNMCGGFPLVVSAEQFRTSEALYQALRFPDHEDVQEMVRGEKSPMSAKMAAKGNVEKTRHDWDAVRVDIMRFAVRVKFAQHRAVLEPILQESGDMDIVEKSRKDPFWGALEDDGKLVGTNVLGGLIMEIRHAWANGITPTIETPPGCILFGKTI